MSVEHRCDKCGKVIPDGDYFPRSVDLMNVAREVLLSGKLDLCRGCARLVDVQVRELLAKTQVKA